MGPCEQAITCKNGGEINNLTTGILLDKHLFHSHGYEPMRARLSLKTNNNMRLQHALESPYIKVCVVLVKSSNTNIISMIVVQVTI